MLLILITVIISFHAKRFYTVPVFVIVSHIIAGILHFYSTTTDGSGLLLSALISLVIGPILYGWTLWYKRKHGLDEFNRIKRRVTKVLVLFILIVALICILALYIHYSIGSGNNNTQLNSVADTQKAKAPEAKSIIQQDQSLDVKGDINAPTYNQELYVQNASTKRAPYKQGDVYEDGSIFLYREPIEIYWNDWTAFRLPNKKIYVSGQGTTVSFEGVLGLNCENGWGYIWRAAGNYSNDRSMTDEETRKIVPPQVISAAFKEFCPK